MTRSACSSSASAGRFWRGPGHSRSRRAACALAVALGALAGCAGFGHRLSSPRPLRWIPEALLPPAPPPADRWPGPQLTPISVPIELTLRPARRTLPPGRTLVVPVVIEVRAGTAPLIRPPLDLALVLDTSNSMGRERRLERTLEAARLVIASLTAQDTLSIVTFGQQATVLEHQQPVTGALDLTHWLDEVEPSGWSNLSSGLLAALDELRRNPRPGATRRVLLLTDGEGNYGLTDRPTLFSIARQAGLEGIAISTLGVGSDDEATLVDALARLSTGRYQRVDGSEGIPSAVGREVGGLVPAAAEEVELELVAGPGSRVLDLELQESSRVGPRGSLTDPERARPTSARLGSLRLGEQRSLFAIVRAAGGRPGQELVMLEARLSYRDPGRGGQPRTVARALRLVSAETEAAYGETAEQELLAEVRLARLLELARRAVRERDSALAWVARQRIADAASELGRLAVTGRSEELRQQAALVQHLGVVLQELSDQGALRDRAGDAPSTPESGRP